MPLTVRTNGSSTSNIITAAWWNDYYNLLTGAMQDQEVSIKNLMILSAIGAAPSSAPTLALAAGSSLGVGVYKYVVTFANADGETVIGPSANITTTTGNTNVVLTAIPTGPTGTTKRYVYRTTVGGSTYYRDNTLNDNTTTGYTDSTSDATLTSGGGTLSPAHPSFGGSLIIRDSTGVMQAQIYSDGTLAFNGPVNQQPAFSAQVSGTQGTATLYQYSVGLFKVVDVQIFNWQKTTAGDALLNIPTPFTNTVIGWSQSTNQFHLNHAGVAQTMSILTTLGTAGNNFTAGSATNAGSWNFFFVGGIDQVGLFGSTSGTFTGHILMMGV